MEPAEQELVIEEGVGFQDLWTFAAEEDSGDLSPLDLTGWTGAMHLRERYDSATPRLVLTDTNGKLVLGGSAGSVQVIISRADADTLGPSFRGVWDIVLTAPSGRGYRFLKGPARVSRGVTR